MNSTINSLHQYNGPQNNNIPSSHKIKSTWAKVTLFVRVVIVITISLYILSWIMSIEKILENIPYYTINEIQIWRLFTGVFMTSKLLNILFAFISWITESIRLENTSGTVRYSLNFVVNSIFIQILFSFEMFLISLFAGIPALNVRSTGLWSLIIAEITTLSLGNPNSQVQIFYIPYSFRAVYYPWILYAFIIIINFNIQFDVLAGISYGYLYFYYLRNKIKFSDNCIIKYEKFSCVKFLSKVGAFISLQTLILNSASFSGYQTTDPSSNNVTNSSASSSDDNTNNNSNKVNLTITDSENLAGTNTENIQVKDNPEHILEAYNPMVNNTHTTEVEKIDNSDENRDNNNN